MAKPLTRIVSTVDQYFFTYYKYHNLGFIRIFLVFVAIVHYSGRPMDGFLTYSVAENIHTPPLLIQFLELPYPLPPDWLSNFKIVFITVGFLAMVGLFTRVSLFVFGLLLIYLMGTQALMGWFDHEAGASSQVLLVLALAPGSKAFSMDRLIRWVYHRGQGKMKSLQSALVGPPVSMWGMRLILILLAATYFTAGMSKIRFSEGRWWDGETLTFYLDGRASSYRDTDVQRFFGAEDLPQDQRWRDGFGIQAHHYMNAQNHPAKTMIGKTIASYGWIMILLSVGTLVLELVAPAILIDGWIRLLVLISFIILHVSIGFLMNISFRELLVLDFFLIDWAWVSNRLQLKERYQRWQLR